MVVDVRSGSFFGALREVVAKGVEGRRTTLVFLEADDDVLVRRQEAARRPHPLQAGGRLLDGIAREREVIARPARRRRPGDRHQQPQRPPARPRKIARSFGTEDRLALHASPW